MSTEQNPTCTVMIKGQRVEFVSAFAALADAYHALAKSAPTSEFALSLLARARARKLSDLQISWLHKLATDTVKPTEEVMNLLPIVKLLQTAKNAGNPFPRIELHSADRKIVLTLCGAKARCPGGVRVTDGVRYPNATTYCTIQADGLVVPYANFPLVADQLKALAADPASAASQHGVATGVCCFCSRTLTNRSSVEVGYGPICAEMYGLPWGGEAPTATELDEGAE